MPNPDPDLLVDPIAAVQERGEWGEGTPVGAVTSYNQVVFHRYGRRTDVAKVSKAVGHKYIFEGL
jgi:hypothetical protein